MKRTEATVIGLGGLGTTLTRTLVECQVAVKSVFNRSGEKASQLASELNIPLFDTFPGSKNQLGDVVFITVSDRAIQEVADSLAELDDDFENGIFAHCSGNESADLLASLKEKGAAIASLHPLQTFNVQSGPEDFQDIFFSLQGDQKAFPVLRSVAKQLGSDVFEVSKEQKSDLHTAAVFASNYLVTLLESSVKTGTLNGLPKEQVKKALFPLIETTLKNAKNRSLEDVLTGPIKRGDTKTVEAHLASLQEQSDLKKLYKLLGLQTVDLAEQSGKLAGTDIEQIRNMLKSD